MKFRVLLIGLLIGCNIAAPVHVKPTVDDCQAALIQVDKNLIPVSAAVTSLAIEDLAQPKPRHMKEWWDEKLHLLSTTASLASSVGHK